MDEKRLKRYKILKEKNNLRIKDSIWKSNTLFCECIDLLEECQILSLEETEMLFEQLQDIFPITNYGCIDWKLVKNCSEIKDIFDIYNFCEKRSKWYILWNQEDIPSISCKLEIIVENIEDVLAVSFDTWLLSKDKSQVIEFYHEGKVTYGKVY